jgi:hypothetical protein
MIGVKRLRGVSKVIDELGLMILTKEIELELKQKEIDDLKQRINQEEVGTELYNSLVEELIDLEKVINSYNKILVKYNDGLREIINKYSDFILNNYFGVINESKLDNSWYRKLELMNKYNVKYEIAKIYVQNIYYIENKEYNVDGGPDTEDFVFLLSVDEFEKYMSSYEGQAFKATEYARKQHHRGIRMELECWLLRTPGKSDWGPLQVFTYVGVDNPRETYSDCRYLRPALWIKQRDN